MLAILTGYNPLPSVTSVRFRAVYFQGWPSLLDPKQTTKRNSMEARFSAGRWRLPEIAVGVFGGAFSVTGNSTSIRF